jgi:hypothetical protein
MLGVLVIVGVLVMVDVSVIVGELVTVKLLVMVGVPVIVGLEVGLPGVGVTVIVGVKVGVKVEVEVNPAQLVAVGLGGVGVALGLAGLLFEQAMGTTKLKTNSNMRRIFFILNLTPNYKISTKIHPRTFKEKICKHCCCYNPPHKGFRTHPRRFPWARPTKHRH